MPYYQYVCESCNSPFETRLTYEECDIPTTKPCPTCKKKKVKREIGAPALGDPIKLKVKRPDSTWNDVLGKVKKSHPNGNWDTKFTPTSGR